MRLIPFIFLLVWSGIFGSAFIQYEARTKPPRQQETLRIITDTPSVEIEARAAELPVTTSTLKPRNPVVIHPGKPKTTPKPSPPTTTKTTTTSTTTTAPPKAVVKVQSSSSARQEQRSALWKPECPSPSGLFPFRGDCRRFINCWKGRPFVLTCASGTLFNAATSECDHPYKVKCRIAKSNEADSVSIASTTTTTQAPVESGAVMQRSGQTLRLRGGGGPWEGYVEYLNKGKWGLVCDDDGAWTTADSTVVCKQLGYPRGVQRSAQGPEFGPVSQDVITMYGVKCSGNESSIQECQTQTSSVCHIPDQIVGVRCNREPGSVCPPGEHAWNSHCYRVVNGIRTGRNQARSFCERGKADLAYITSQAENNFVSDMLLQASDGSSFHTDGIAIKGLRKILWMWEHSEEPLNFTKWWPGWDATGNYDVVSPPELKKSPVCIVLKSKFKKVPQSRRVDYYFWALEDCETQLPFVCKRKARDIGCLVGNGASYVGSANVSSTGMQCLNWDDNRINHVLANKARSAVAKKEVHRGVARSSSGPFSVSHNFCRNPHGESKPWCFVSPQEMEYCDIPVCPGDNKLLSRTLNCPVGQFQCKGTGDCLSSAWVCDGDTDCSDGSDEQFCQDYISEFTPRNDSHLVGYDAEKWLHTSADTCARRCSEAKEITCRSFNHNPATNECVLTESNVGLSGKLARTTGWSFYERKVYSLNCSSSGLFECTNGKCINETLVCNGKHDCEDRSDEIVCKKDLDFAIRLGGTNKTNEGRIEVRAFGHWGGVCDDMFGLIDGNVACIQLGFPLGAARIIPQGAYGPIAQLLMDDVECLGNETSLADCVFGGWGSHDCSQEESVGVRCVIATDECPSDQFRCEQSGACINAQYVCDTVDDCGDGSDEDRSRCQSEVIIRLADGPDKTSGRVEVRHRGIWGTICDDDFGQEEATVFCKMLGLNGTSVAVREGGFGPGRGPIWLDEMRCTGNEKNLLECHRSPWGQHNCKHTEDAGLRCSVQLKEVPARPIVSPTLEGDPALAPLHLPKCGTRPLFAKDFVLSSSAPTAKVVKGEPVQPGFLPWQVGLRVRHSGGAETNHWCGAAVLTEDFIITAAHCLGDHHIGSFVMRVGDHSTEQMDPDEEEFAVESLYVYDLFNQGSYLNHDIALIRIKRKRGRGISFGPFVQPICLPKPDAEYRDYMNCTIAGWGSSGSPGAAYAIKLQSATVPVLPSSICRADFVYGKDRILPGMLCSGYLEGGVDSCQGDSGGPLVCEVEGRPTIMGITSWGFGCGRPNKPGVYTRVTHYLEWIYTKLRKISDPK